MKERSCICSGNRGSPIERTGSSPKSPLPSPESSNLNPPLAQNTSHGVEGALGAGFRVMGRLGHNFIEKLDLQVLAITYLSHLGIEPLHEVAVLVYRAAKDDIVAPNHTLTAKSSACKGKLLACEFGESAQQVNIAHTHALYHTRLSLEPDYMAIHLCLGSPFLK